uniref:Nitrite reductase n=1 Tax=Limnospira platensis PCC 7345 TaxID=129975 RepID=J9PHT9_LIMPL|nr:nitrite reductase [Arthrospira platensis PCC 7345]
MRFLHIIYAIIAKSEVLCIFNYKLSLILNLIYKSLLTSVIDKIMVVASEPKVKLNKIEKAKADKDGLAVKDELEYFAKIGWEAMDKTDLEMRLKWLGVFFRPVTPGKFMLRLRIANGTLNSAQMRVLAEIVQRYGDDGSADITTRQDIQLRGIRLEDLPDILVQMKAIGMTSIHSGMDNVRNLTGSPHAGIEPDELSDTREWLQNCEGVVTNQGEGNYAFSNLPRKFNIAMEGDEIISIHAEINDLAFVPADRDDVLGFNVLVGGYSSAQRQVEAVPINVWVPANDDVIKLSIAILTVYTQNGLTEGLRENRQRARLMWLVDTWGVERFRAEVQEEFGQTLATAALKDEITQDKKDYLGVHPQKQQGYKFVGLHVPVGRLSADQMFEVARLAEVYGQGEIRLTLEQNLLYPYISEDKLEAFLAEPLLEVFSINPAPLTRSLVSCTGNNYCNFALIETKQRALKLARELDEELEISDRVRIHWTGCPNSCGQPQVADIGFIGTKARKDGKTVEAVDIYTGGKVGHEAELGSRIEKGVACDDLKPIIRDLLIQKFGARPKQNH